MVSNEGKNLACAGSSESRNVTGKQKTAVLEEMTEIWLDSNGGQKCGWTRRQRTVDGEEMWPNHKAKNSIGGDNMAESRDRRQQWGRKKWLDSAAEVSIGVSKMAGSGSRGQQWKQKCGWKIRQRTVDRAEICQDQKAEDSSGDESVTGLGGRGQQ